MERTYTVVYEIETDADSPMDAALQVEEILLSPSYRPVLGVKLWGTDDQPIEIDLENG